jgi:hypothetical protein
MCLGGFQSLVSGFKTPELEIRHCILETYFISFIVSIDP